MANAQVRITLIESVRGGQHLYYEGHKFRCKYNRNGKKYWISVVSGCNAHLTTEGDMFHTLGQLPHTHPVEPFLTEVDAFKAKLIFRSKTETTPIPTIYGDEISRLRLHHNTVPEDLLKEIPSLAQTE